jgi:hypothetical protein
MTRTRYQRRCHDCGSTSSETAFPGTRKPTRRIDRCSDCLAEFERIAERPEASIPPIVTRASYRAAYRHRAKQPQGDLVDLVVAPP